MRLHTAHPRRKLVRSPNLVAYWDESKFVVEDFGRQRRFSASPWITLLLDEFRLPRTARYVANRFPPFSPGSVRRQIHKLVRHRFLIPEDDRVGRRNIPLAWQRCFAAAYFHFSLRDAKYIQSPAKVIEFLRRRLREVPQPPIFKSYPKCRSIALARPLQNPKPRSIEAILKKRRTWRSFGVREITLRVLSAVIGGTWGQTAWIDGGELGPLIGKTSPSAGARHPIECYVLCWKVSGLDPGSYHFAVDSNSLELLQLGDFRDEAVRIASGQAWVRNASFLCIMTALVDRVYWKYISSDAYRLFFLDAGHLAQTFALLATRNGLASFTTAAIQETRVERLLKLDGLREFPVYLCGAGVPPPSDIQGTSLLRNCT